MTNPLLADTLIIGYENQSNYPYETGQGEQVDGDKPGIAVEHVQWMAKKLNLSLQFKRMPWKRALVELETGRIDGVIDASFKAERLKQGRYPQRYGEPDPSRRMHRTSYALYRLKGSPVNWDGKVFSNIQLNIAAPRGYSIVSDLQKMKVPVQEHDNTTHCLTLLAKGRVDGVAALELAAKAVLQQDPERFAGIEQVPTLLRTKNYYLMLSHQFVAKHPELAENIWDTIAQIRESTSFRERTKFYFQ